ncbi:MAG: 4-hydroxy-tetrahydrodipicolinate synthase, partial [Bacteroidota bacterium]
VNYIVTLGTTGESATLTKTEKTSIINFTYEKVNKKVPVVVGIGGNNTQEIIEDLKYYPLEKASAVLSVSPYYNKPSQEGIFQHYKAIAAASPQPVILYNVPGRTNKNITAETTLRLAALENIIGIKEASGDFEQCMDIIKNKPADFFVVSGDDGLSLAQIAAGMTGVISVAANAFPKEFAAMINLCLEGNFAEARTIHFSLLKAYHLMFAENNPAGVKAFMHQKGLLANELRLPLTPLSNGLNEAVKEFKFN